MGAIKFSSLKVIESPTIYLSQHRCIYCNIPQGKLQALFCALHVNPIFTEAPQKSDQMVGIEEIALEDADGVKLLIGAEVEVVKRNELHSFKVLPKRWVLHTSLHASAAARKFFGGLHEAAGCWRHAQRGRLLDAETYYLQKILYPRKKRAILWEKRWYTSSASSQTAPRRFGRTRAAQTKKEPSCCAMAARGAVIILRRFQLCWRTAFV
jgi:hypothetical protein